MDVKIINNTKRAPLGGKANGSTGKGTDAHTIRAEDLRIHKPIPGQGGLSMVVKLK